jgi:hypothetical protein
MKIGDLIEELKRFNPRDEIAIEICPEDIIASDLADPEPEPAVFPVNFISPRFDGTPQTCILSLGSPGK